MPTLPSGKYQLKTLHEEIDLFDRKLAHLHKYETFATEAERNVSADKLAAKRSLLVRKAQQMIDEGIEFNEFERPKSLRSDTTAAEEKMSPSSAEAIASVDAVVALAPSSQPSPYAGTSLDSQQTLQDYKKSRVKRKTALSA